ncbi:DUF3015 family protein [Spirobacillus cienkowskii]
MLFRKILQSTALLSLGITSLCYAKSPFGMAGCGFGSQVMGENGNQVFAATTNGSLFGSQFFGITSGTSNCLEPSQEVALTAQQRFIADNFSALSKEIAQGDGESLKAFSSTFGCKKDIYPNFAVKLQNSYEKIFISPGSMAALEVIQSEIKNDPVLVNGCSLII